MIEIDHTLQPATPPPVPAKPILASRLLELEQKQRKRFAARGETVQTGCREVDEYVLGGGGFERGIVVGISASEGDEGRLVSLDLFSVLFLIQPCIALNREAVCAPCGHTKPCKSVEKV